MSPRSPRLRGRRVQRIADGPTASLLNGAPEHWVETLTGFAENLRFDTFVFWPDKEPLEEL